MEKLKKRRRFQRQALVPMNPDAAGIEVGATFHVVAIPSGRAEETVRSFRSFTGDLHALADWLKAVGVTPSRWNRPESTGYRHSRFSRSVGSRFSWSTLGT